MPHPQARTLKPIREGKSFHQSRSPKNNSGGRISAACEACKRRKTKCTGGPAPCQLCESLGTECVIDLSLDMRRRAALQRTLDESKTYEKSLVHLLECIRTGDLSIVQTLMEMLHCNAQLPQLSAAIQNHPITYQQNWINLDNELAVGSQTETNLTTCHLTAAAFTKIETPCSPGKVLHSVQHQYNPGTPKKAADSRYILALLRQLRKLTDDDGEIMLRNAIDEHSLPELFRNMLLDWPQLEPSIQRKGSAGMQFPNDRAYWHPALSLSHPTDIEENVLMKGEHEAMRKTFHPESNFAFERDDTLRATVTRTSKSFPTSRSGSDATCSQRDLPAGLLASRMVDSPFIEPYELFPFYNVQHLVVAHENPDYCLRIPVYLVQPLLVPDESIMSRVYTDFLQAAKQMISNGTPVEEILGPNDDIIVDLLFRQREPHDRWDCSSWACEVYRSFSEYDQSIKMANAFFLTRMMRWRLKPINESYAKLPDMMKPTPAQRQIPHIGAIDLIPLPCVRDSVISELRDWLTTLGEAQWTVNWPYPPTDAVEIDSRTGSRRLTTKFMDHVIQYTNWSVGSSFLKVFPELAGRINIHQNEPH